MHSEGRGYLYVSRDRIRYAHVAEQRHGAVLDAPRSDLRSSRESTDFVRGWAELQFGSAGTWNFSHIVCDARGEDSRMAQDVLDAVGNFDEGLARVKAEVAAREQARARMIQKVEARVERDATAPLLPYAAQNTLRITSQPGGAQVYLDDAPRGTTSPDEGKLVLENLPVGNHKLRVGLSGYTDWIQSVTLTEGSTLYIDAKLTVAGPLPFTSQDVVDLLKGSVSARRAADLVKERGVDFALTESLEQEIRAAGGDSDLLLALTKAKAAPPPSPPPAVPPTITLLEPVGAESGREIQATGPMLRVRGTASHPGGIASVSVNGQRAPARTLSPQTLEFDAGDLPVGSGSTAFVVIAMATDKSELRLTLKVARSQPAPPEPKPSAGPPPITLKELETALENELPKARIIELVNQYGVNFDLTEEAERRLRAAGANSELLLAIAKAKK